MKIDLKLPDGDFEKREVKEGITLEELYDEVRDQVTYPCVAAKVDNEYQSLTYSIAEECSVELLDMRTKGACRIYQSSISMVFLCAAKKVLGDVPVEISNTLNKGLFIEIRKAGGSRSKSICMA